MYYEEQRVLVECLRDGNWTMQQPPQSERTPPKEEEEREEREIVVVKEELMDPCGLSLRKAQRETETSPH
jgi:hypothetical protein